MGYLHNLLIWFGLIHLLGILTLPLAWRAFRSLADRGYTFSKTLGVLLTGTGAWLFSVYGSIGVGMASAWLAIFLIGGISWLPILRREKRPKALKRLLRWKFPSRCVWASEVLFLGSFLAMAILRIHSPAASHTEQPMDLMLNVATFQSTEVPPEDPWLAGYPVGYYYFGYWLQGCLAHATGTPPEITYNMGLIAWFSLLAIGVFGIAYNLLAPVESGRSRATLATRAGVATGLAVVVFGNLYSFVEWLYSLGLFPAALARALKVPGFPEKASITGTWFVGSDWWWWRSSRLFEDFDLEGRHLEVIAEFPMFSYILGDNHPHLLAMPFAVLVIALSMSLFFSSRTTVHWTPGRKRDRALALGILGVATGALSFINSWDFPAYFLLALAACSWMAVPNETLHTRIRSVLLLCGTFLFSALICFWPHLMSAQSQVRGLAPNVFYPTGMVHLLLMFGPWLGGLIAYLWLLQERHQTGWKRSVGWGVSGIAGAWGILIAGWLWALGTEIGRRSYPNLTESLRWEQFLVGLDRWTQSPLVLIVLGALCGLVCSLLLKLSRGESPSGHTADIFLLLLALAGILLLLVPELIYVRDSFETRMNTVFKFYYQAWLFVGLAGAVGAIRALQGKERGPRIFALVSLLLIGMGVFFPAAAGYGKVLSAGERGLTLDALAYLRESQPAEYATIEWIRKNTPNNAVVLQAVGESYQPHTARLSAATGRPTLLGWAGHERQWRGSAFDEMARGREDAVRDIYSSKDPARVSQLLQTWNIDYVFLGPVEVEKYPVDREDERGIRRLLVPVFESGGFSIFQRNR